MFPTAVTVGFQSLGLGMLERWNVALQKLGSFFPKYFLRPCWVASVTKTTMLLPHPRWMTYSFLGLNSWNNKPIIFGNDVFLSWMKHDKFLIWIHFELIFNEDQLKIKLTNWKFPPKSGWTLVLIFAVRLVVGAWDYKCETQIQMYLDTKKIHQTFEPLVSNAAMENLHFWNKKNISTSFCLVSFYLIPFHRWYHSTNISDTFPSVCVPMIRLDHVWHET